ncbi:hypothetical protein PROAA_1600012 [Candidatus Propionivibrio aalborgensis]|uniref:Uncharacterized protein n=1 Tax=Candidatus Propionivibrio aalborgensis TaxID=1860101 RepID=A0A1A8XKD7_9RHOO|nr:hypothetical protein PROAA_1600012 [Candidatus Propionivibrio aalborgensis]
MIDGACGSATSAAGFSGTTICLTARRRITGLGDLSGIDALAGIIGGVSAGAWTRFLESPLPLSIITTLIVVAGISTRAGKGLATLSKSAACAITDTVRARTNVRHEEGNIDRNRKIAEGVGMADHCPTYDCVAVQ